MHLFFAGDKREMMILRDTLNDLLSDPQLDRKDAEIRIKSEYNHLMKIERSTVVETKEET